MSKKFEVNTYDFNPLNITGLQLYLNRYNATPSSWLDVSSNGYNFAQSTATKQPIVTNNSVDFDGVDDVQSVAGSNLLNDNSGIMFFSWYNDGVNNSIFISSADPISSIRYIIFSEDALFRIRLLIRYDSVFENIILSTNSSVIGYNYAYIKSNGSSYTFNLNGVNEVIFNHTGLNDGKWFNDVLFRNNLTLSTLMRSTIFHAKSSLNKMIYSNAALSSGEIDDIMNFMSDENN